MAGACGPKMAERTEAASRHDPWCAVYVAQVPLAPKGLMPGDTKAIPPLPSGADQHRGRFAPITDLFREAMQSTTSVARDVLRLDRAAGAVTDRIGSGPVYGWQRLRVKRQRWRAGGQQHGCDRQMPDMTLGQLDFFRGLPCWRASADTALARGY